jgi:hypothetical protein
MPTVRVVLKDGGEKFIIMPKHALTHIISCAFTALRTA